MLLVKELVQQKDSNMAYLQVFFEYFFSPMKLTNGSEKICGPII